MPPCFLDAARVDRTAGGPPGAKPAKEYIVSFTKFHRHGLGSLPSRFMRALCHHYGVELQHFSPNAITIAAVFAAVCEGYLGVMPH